MSPQKSASSRRWFASYDLLLGYTGSVSFAHTMFYGIGSYAIAIALYSMGPTWAAVATGLAIGCRWRRCWRLHRVCSRCAVRRFSLP